VLGEVGCTGVCGGVDWVVSSIKSLKLVDQQRSGWRPLGGIGQQPKVASLAGDGLALANCVLMNISSHVLALFLFSLHTQTALFIVVPLRSTTQRHSIMCRRARNRAP
jgi:hypothetical protein